jgi:hypothetical protein
MEFAVFMGIMVGVGLAAVAARAAIKAGRSGNAWWQRGNGDNSWMFFDGARSRHDPCDDGLDFDGGGGDGGGCDGGGDGGGGGGD